VRVVFDTNIYISAFAIPGGNAEDAYLEAVRDTFELFTSVAILTEIAQILQTKFYWTTERTRDAVQAISATATVLRPRPSLHVLKDEPDNRILECALAAQAEWIVSGDRHLLMLKKYGHITIVSLSHFLSTLQK
jgi:putative PIN family toxin of toxin-antitoxin system